MRLVANSASTFGLTRGVGPSRIARPIKALRTGPLLSVAFALLAGGCAVSAFDLPEKEGVPTVNSIVERVTCELIDLVRKDGPHAKHRTTLLTGNYEVAVALSLQVTDSGELSPNLNFPYPPLFDFNAGIKLARSREQNFTQNLYFSMATLDAQSKISEKFGRCPVADTNLAGELGIRDTVFLAMTPGNRNVAATLDGGGEFGGHVNFVVTRNINALGPTWTLTHFKGPGNLGSLSRINTDKITFAFAPGKGTPVDVLRPTTRSREFLNQLILSQINSNR